MHVLRYICKTCSIRNIFFVFILVFAIIPAFTVYFCFKSFTTGIVADKYINEYLMSLSSQIDYRFEAYEDQLNTGCLRISLSPDRIKRIKNDDNTEALMTDAFSELSAISYAQIVTPEKTYTYSASGGSFDFNGQISDEFIKSLSNMGFKMMNKPVSSGGRYYALAGQNLYDYYNSKSVGYLLIYTDEAFLSTLYKNLQTDNISCFITIDNCVLSSRNKSSIGNELFITETSSVQGRIPKTLIRKTKITNAFGGSISVTSIVSITKSFRIIKELGLINRITLIASMLLALLVSMMISRNCLKSIRRVNKNIMLFAENPQSYIPPKCSGEIASFENQFNEMVEKVRELMKKNEYEREKAHIAELCTLQSQIKHHFVYNTLDIVSWKARESNQPEIEKIILALASYFRTSLSRGSNFITIREEISLVKNYLFLEQMRFGDMFEAEFDISEDILGIYILKIILQPIVENCIKHGFKDIGYKGKILIKGSMQNGTTIVFDIIDNGRGIKASITEDSFKDRSDKIGYGLYNIYERLHFEYGESGKLSFIDTGGHGTHVRVSIKCDNSKMKSAEVKQ